MDFSRLTVADAIGLALRSATRLASKIDIAVLHVVRRFDSLWMSVNALLADGKRRQFGESFEGRLAHGALAFVEFSPTIQLSYTAESESSRPCLFIPLRKGDLRRAVGWFSPLSPLGVSEGRRDSTTPFARSPKTLALSV